MNMRKLRGLMGGAALALACGWVAAAGAPALPPYASQILPSGQLLSPLASPGAVFAPLNPHLPGYSGYTAGQAVSTAVSPDGKTLLILTSGFNQLTDAQDNTIAAASNEYVFVEDIAGDKPVQAQVLQVPNTYMGIAFAPDGRHFYVSGGVDDDVHVFGLSHGGWAEQGKPIALGHYKGVDRKSDINDGGVGLGVMPATAGLAVTADGSRLVAANFYSDTISVIGLASGRIVEVPLRPGVIDRRDRGMAGGEYPFWVAIKGNDTAYVSSLRDREVDVLSLAGTPRLVRRIPVNGNPEKMILNRAGGILYVTCDNGDDVVLINTRTNRVSGAVRTIAPAGMLADAEHYRGVGPNGVALSPDQRTLYVTNGGTDTVAVIDLMGVRPAVTGLIPTGYFPNALSVSADGRELYVVNGKSIAGPNPGNCTADPAKHIDEATCDAANQYILQLSKAGFLALPVPTGAALALTTRIAAHDDHFDEMPSAADEALMAQLHQRIRHIIYILRENRTYDEELGDLGEGNGDAALAEFGQAITPNAHRMADEFVDLDNFYDSGEVSGNGWPWSTSAHESDIGAKNLPINYAGRGLSYDWEGTNRNVEVGVSGLAAREAVQPVYGMMPDPADVLPGPNNVAAPDGPQGQFQRGYIWDAAIRAGLTVRNYGFFEDLARYHQPAKLGGIPPGLTDPFASATRVAFPSNPVLAPRTDLYFRGFDNAFPDYYREAEWRREFDAYVKNDNLPSLTLLRLMHDHLGSFKTAIDGVNTPETEMADNDYAVGEVIAAVAHSKYAGSTLIIVLEDDAQDGPDHVDAHRSVAYFVGPYVKRHAVISTRYSTVNILRTIEDILGTDHLSVNDAFQRPMADVFDLSQKTWTYGAVVPAPLSATSLPIPKQAAVWHNAEPASYWAAATAGYDWSEEDRVPAVRFNMVLWRGLRPGVPYPTAREDPDIAVAPDRGDDGD
jgi:DNA-binding beta-propeller fold protein YncE